jgi:O-antigen ligase
VNEVKARTQAKTPLEMSAWIALVTCVATTPLAVGRVPFGPAPFVFDYFVFPQNVTLAIGAAIALALWGAAVLTKQTKVVASWTMIPFAAFVAWAGVATVAGLDPMKSLLGASTSPLSLAMIATYAALLFMTVQLADSRQRLRTLTWTVVISATCVGLPALFQQLFGVQFFGQPFPPDWMVGRGFSTMGNPDQLGTFLVLPAILAALLALYEEDRVPQLVAGACTLLLVMTLTATLTRGAWLAALVGAVLIAALLWRTSSDSRRSVRATIILGLCLAGVAVALLATDHNDLGTRFNAQPVVGQSTAASEVVNTASSDRLNLWKSSLLIVSQRPLTGTGPAAYELGWYRNAINPSSGGGEGGLADDPHSLVFFILTTTGVPGLLFYLVATGCALVIGVRNVLSLKKAGSLSGKAAYYVAWFIAAVALQVALLVAAVNSAIIMYAFISFGVLLRPAARPLESSRSDGMRLPLGIASVACALTLAVAAYPSIGPENALARATRSGSPDAAAAAAARVPWNIAVQKAYFHLRVGELDSAIAGGASSARDQLDALVAELEAAGSAHPHELYYPSVRAQVLTQASEQLGDPSVASAAVQAADDALTIMPAHIPSRVNKALALSDLKRYREMADALSGYWQNELSSPYPGILYAQGLALSGSTQRSTEVFDLLARRFPRDASVQQARDQTQQLLQQK